MLGLGLAISLMQALFMLLICDEVRSFSGLHGALPHPMSSHNLQPTCGVVTGAVTLTWQPMRGHSCHFHSGKQCEA